MVTTSTTPTGLNNSHNLRFGRAGAGLLSGPMTQLTTLGARSGRRLGSTFEKIINQFVWYFLAMDVIGIWIPRIGVSLKRGRIPYNVEEDPQAKNLPLHRKVMRHIWHNAKGLNWINFVEEAGREFCTGPGTLMIPTMVYSVARRRSAAIELSRGHLKEYTEAFMAHLDEKANAANRRVFSGLASTGYTTEAQQALKQELQRFMLGSLTDGTMKKTTLDKQALQALSDIIHAGYDPAHDFHTATQGLLKQRNVTIEQFMENWSDRWLNVVMGQRSKVEKRKLFKVMEREIKAVLMDGYNKGPRLERSLSKLSNQNIDSIAKQSSDLMRAEILETRFGDMPISEFVESMRRWIDVPLQTARKIKASDTASFSERIGKTAQRVMRNKGLLIFGTVVSTAVYLAALAFKMQSHDVYPGERLAYQHSGHKPFMKTSHQADTPQAQQLQAQRNEAGAQNPFAVVGGVR